MLTRYRKTEDGKTVARALVYTASEHGIDRSHVDPDAVRIVERLQADGQEAYIVGGAVRDLLLGRTPKDFDIATAAEPARIKRVFRNARVIGRRFRLVHVYAGPKIFEVATFRSIAQGTVGNEYGTIDEDALRRDFTCNALYYDPVQEQLVDFVGGFRHIKAKRIVPVIALATIFEEDPVRMIRCAKYAATTGFRIPLTTRWAMKRDCGLLAGASPSRLTEEFLKILASGKSEAIIRSLEGFKLLTYIVPLASAELASGSAFRTAFMAELAELDTARNAEGGRERRMAILIAHFLRAFLETRGDIIADRPDAYQEALREARSFLSPLNLPRVELEAAVMMVFKKRGLSPLERPRRPGPERGHGLPERPGRRGERGGERSPRVEALSDSGNSKDPAEGRAGGRIESETGRPHTGRPEGRRSGPQKSAPERFDDTNGTLTGTSDEAAGEGQAKKRRRKRGRKPTGEGSSAPEGSEADRTADSGSTQQEDTGLSRTSGAARRRRKRQKKDGSPPEQAPGA
ncbi:MAG: polynucleotide adenylyltransferase PcnB [Rectinemataceae bacterium]